MTTATEIAAQVRAGARAATEVVTASLDRIEAQDAGIGAFQLVDREGATRAAAELDLRTDRSELPLAGVPVAIKDNVDVAGLPTRHGSAASPAGPAVADDELVRRLRAAGAVVVGKTRLPELAIWGFTESIAFGGTRNPRNPTRNAGGSTGGGAAAVAAGLVPLALGSDGGGSLRIPPANCGVVGFKPANGTVPLAGGLSEHWYGCSANGPVTATVADAVLAMDVLAAGPGWRGTADAELSIAVSLRNPSPIGRPDATARAAVRIAADALRAAGHRVSSADPPYRRSLADVWVGLWLGGIAEEVERLGLPLDRLEPRTRSMVAKGRRLRDRGEFRGGTVARGKQAWQDAVGPWFQRYHVLLSPVIARPAPPMGWGTRASYVKGYLNGAWSTPYTQAWNVAGYPAMSLPLGGTPQRPGAVQLVAAPGHEADLLAAAVVLESAGRAASTPR